MDHYELAQQALAESIDMENRIDFESYEEPFLAKAELALKRAHVHAMLAVADATNSQTLDILMEWRSR